jgi:hypothetical protein
MTIGIVLPREGDVAVVQAAQPAIGDGHATFRGMSILGVKRATRTILQGKRVKLLRIVKTI